MLTNASDFRCDAPPPGRRDTRRLRLLTSTRFALVFLVVAGGCAKPERDAGFEDVHRNVADRIGHEVRWNRGTDEDEQAASAVRGLLRRELDANAAVQVALLSNRDIQATYEQLGVAQADLVQAGLLRNPIFVGDLWFFKYGGNFELSITQNFIDVFLVGLRKRAAAAAFQASKARVTNAVINLAADARAAFYTYQAAAQTLEMRRSIAAATRSASELAERINAAGNMTDLDLHNERALAAQSQLDLTASEAAVVEARERLNELMGLSGPDTGWTAPARLPDLPAAEASADGIEERAVAESLDLEAAARDVDAARERLGMARPMAVFGDSDVGFTTQAESGGTWGYGPAFSLPIPLFDQGTPAAARAAAELRAAQQRQAALAVRVRARTRAAVARALAARSRARQYKLDVLPLRQQIVEETHREYNGMLVGTFQLLTAKQQQIEAGRQSIEALRDYWLARTELDRLVGGRLPPAGAAATAPAATSMPGPAEHEGQAEHGGHVEHQAGG